MNKKIIAAVWIINYRNLIVLGKKSLEIRGFLRGKWHLPGGKLMKNQNKDC